jgi:6-phosphogluconolactonase
MDRITFSDSAAASVAPFDTLADCARLTADHLKRGTVALSGGSTYAALFPEWLKLNLDLKNTSFFPIDERIVPFDDPQSNWGTATREFLGPAGIGDQKAHFASSVQQYKELLRDSFGRGMPVIDTVFLGVGDDGHTASLFPGGDYLDDLSTVVMQTVSPKPPPDRITLGPGVIAAARNVVVIVEGEAKRPVVEGLRQGDAGLPIVRVLSLRPNSEILVGHSLLNRS